MPTSHDFHIVMVGYIHLNLGLEQWKHKFSVAELEKILLGELL
jgi:hypothetical protein